MFQRPERKTLLLLSAAVLVLALTSVVVMVISVVGVNKDETADDVLCAPCQVYDERQSVSDRQPSQPEQSEQPHTLYTPVRYFITLLAPYQA